ncbi:MAG: peptidoglycan bridge formation glycyltransferase FemA/FemB family protein [Anaerolineae bacterium]
MLNQDWDAFVQQQTRAHVLQLSAWGELKCAFGWDYEIVTLNDHNAITAGALLLFRALPARLGTMAYLPMGPYVTHDAQWEPLWSAVRDAARRHHAAFLKWEPGIYHDTPPDFTQWKFQASPQTVQPPNTILIDLTPDDDAMMARMNQGTRRKIRQSYKNDVQYYEGSRADVEKFNALMQATGTRNEFGVHEPRYYELAYELFAPDDAALILAEHEGDVLAGIMVFAVGDTALYLYGASSDVKRNLMATYGVQWEAIQWAKRRGCRWYDLWGIPDEDEATLESQFQERGDGLWGVYGFKRGWGGQVIRSAGAWDRVYNPLVYTAYKTALRVRS